MKLVIEGREISKLAIFGAKSIALGVCRAVQNLYPECNIEGFLVSNKAENPSTLAGLPVVELGEYQGKDTCILIAVPENIQGEIVDILERQGFYDHICVDSAKESALMEQYYNAIHKFPSVYGISAEEYASDNDSIEGSPVSQALRVYVVKCYRDRPLQCGAVMPDWTVPIQAGAALTEARVAEVVDNVGENISEKNTNYCELTALYWMWKNQLTQMPTDGIQYYGLFHYRRFLDLKEADVAGMLQKDVDVVLPFPLLCEPDIREHHSRYIKESDWQAAMQAIQELQPEYAQAYQDIFRQPYMYNHNMIIAKRQVLADYCAWLFPILTRIEELSEPKGWERADRYIGYIGESLFTLYFMYRGKELEIYHAGRVMLT